MLSERLAVTEPIAWGDRYSPRPSASSAETHCTLAALGSAVVWQPRSASRWLANQLWNPLSSMFDTCHLKALPAAGTGVLSAVRARQRLQFCALAQFADWPAGGSWKTVVWAPLKVAPI